MNKLSHEQAESLASAIEESHADSHENLKEFIRTEFDKQNKDFDNKIGTQINALDNKMNSLENKLGTRINALDNKISELKVDIS